LHCFRWNTTTAIIGDLANCLVNDGLFTRRFNSTEDVNYGAGVGQSIHDQSSLFVVGDIEKRFFTRRCIEKLFVAPWRLLSLREKAIGSFGSRKVLWELVAAKGDRDLAETSPAADTGKPRG
jgi:hypothetical protein